MRSGDASTTLPRNFRESMVEFVDRTPLWALLLIGLSVYSAVVIAATFTQLACTKLGVPVVKEGTRCVQELADLVYFNVVTVLTIGYGDMRPYRWGRVIAGLEAAMGIGIFGVLVSAAVLKLMAPRQ